MSNVALTWAFKQRVPRSAAKFVLVALADRAGGHAGDVAFTSYAYLCEATGLNRKTVMTSLHDLAEWGFIEDSGERRGRTAQIPVYHLQIHAAVDIVEDVKRSKNGPAKEVQKRTGSKNGPGPKTTRKRSKNDPKEVQKRTSDTKDTNDPNISLLRAGKFQPPTVDEVAAYCTERGNRIDPGGFVDFYQSKGWRVGSQPMKDWRAAVRTWEKRSTAGRKSKSSGNFDSTNYEQGISNGRFV